jgi:hypothetical protein
MRIYQKVGRWMDRSMGAMTAMDRIAAREHDGALLSMMLSKIAIEATRSREKPCRLLVVWWMKGVSRKETGRAPQVHDGCGLLHCTQGWIRARSASALSHGIEGILPCCIGR